MSGQGLTAEQIAAAGQQAASNQQQAAPAQNQQQQQAPPAANQQQPAPGNNQQQGEFIVTQAQFDQRWAEKMGSIEKELGLQPGGLKDFVEKSKKAPATATSSEPISGAELRLAKMEALMLAKVPSERIPGLLSRVQGKSKAEIEADIQQMITDGFLVITPAAQPQQQQQQGPPNAAQGAGNTGVPGGTPAKRWKASEINAMTHEQIIANEAEIDKAQKEGRIDYHL